MVEFVASFSDERIRSPKRFTVRGGGVRFRALEIELRAEDPSRALFAPAEETPSELPGGNLLLS